VVSGPRRRGRLLTPEELSRLAYHEAGHAVVASAVDYPAETQRVSVVARGRDAAHADFSPQSDRTVLTRRDLLAEMAISMGGTAAEEMLTGEPSTASEGDVERATDMARRFAGRYGMSSRVGRIRLVKKEEEVFLGRDYLTTQNLSSRTLEEMDSAVRELIDQAEERALQILQQRRGVLDELAAALIERETIHQPELDGILAGRVTRAAAKRARAPRASS
jgi:cell division protease FtsH